MNSMTMLFLEKIVESAACAGRSYGGPPGVVSFALNGGSGDKKRALVADILLGNPFGYRLRALELRPGIKVTAVLAASKVRSAFGTLAAFGDLHGIRNHGTAHGTAQ